MKILTSPGCLVHIEIFLFNVHPYDTGYQKNFGDGFMNLKIEDEKVTSQIHNLGIRATNTCLLSLSDVIEKQYINS